VIYIPSFIKINSGIQNFIGEDSQTHRQHGDIISLILFFQNKVSRLKRRVGNYIKDWNWVVYIEPCMVENIHI
jgi:hypothetical protein